jgi:Uma2 family endonuclease
VSIVEKFSSITPAEYLSGELLSEIRHEYVAGQVFAMVGATRAHNVIAGNIFSVLHGRLRGKPCQVFMSDMKVRSDPADAYYYPDVVVSCEQSPAQSTFLREPLLIVEVLSAGTETIDRREKRLAYQALPSLQEYLLVAQERPQVEVFRRETEGVWLLETYGADESVLFRSIELELQMGLIYEGVSQSTSS